MRRRSLCQWGVVVGLVMSLGALSGCYGEGGAGSETGPGGAGKGSQKPSDGSGEQREGSGEKGAAVPTDSAATLLGQLEKGVPQESENPLNSATETVPSASTAKKAGTTKQVTLAVSGMT